MKGTWEGSGTWQAKGPGGGGVAAAAVVVLVLVIAAAIGRAVAHAASSAIRAVIEAIEITAIVIVAAVGVAVLGFVVWAALAMRRRILEAQRRQAAPALGPRWAVRAEVLDGHLAGLPPAAARPHLHIVPEPVNRKEE
jgi:hypothetical protein